jgi:hypothetical protein
MQAVFQKKVPAKLWAPRHNTGDGKNLFGKINKTA